jgi:hypothetical protein
MEQFAELIGLGQASPRYREDDVLEWLERNAA